MPANSTSGPLELDIGLRRGDSFSRRLTIDDGATPPVAIDVSARTYVWVIDNLDETTAATCAVDMAEAATGQIDFSLTAAQTAALTADLYRHRLVETWVDLTQTLVAGTCRPENQPE